MIEKSAEEKRKYYREWYERHKEARREYQREWRKKNPEKVQSAQERYWARKATGRVENDSDN